MSEAKCPVAHGANSNKEKGNVDWWPKISTSTSCTNMIKNKPFNGSYNYREEVKN